MKKMQKVIVSALAILFMVSAVSVIVIGNMEEKNSTDPNDLQNDLGRYVPVTDITGLPTQAAVGTPITINGTVTPSNATNRIISYGIKNAGTTGATLSGNTFTAASPGTATLTATVLDGEAKMVSAGWYATAAIKTDGTLWVWGSNMMGQLGSGYGWSTTYYTPTQVGTANNWVMVSVGTANAMAINSYGELYLWGKNESGDLGIPGLAAGEFVTPTKVGGSDWAYVSAGNGYAVAIKTNGTLWAWGDIGGTYSHGDMGFTSQITAPVQVGTDSDWKIVSGGVGHPLGIKTNGTLWRLRIDSVQIGYANDWTSVSVGHEYAIAINTKGEMWNISAGNYPTASRLGSDSDWVAISAWNYYAAAIKSNGTIWIRPPTGSDATLPVTVQIGTANDWAAVSAGSSYCMGIKTDGTMWAWGANSNSQFGNGGTTDSMYTPVQTTGTGWSRNFTKDFTITVSTPPSISTTSLPGGVKGTGYSQTLSASGTAPITWAVTSGSLPGGLSLSSGGVISGTPNAGGTFSFTVTASNSGGSASRALSISVATPPTISTSSLPGGIIGTAYSRTLSASGDATITWSVTSGSLPSGLSLSSAGVISGTPAAGSGGTHTFTVTATNGAGSSSRSLSLYIATPPTISTSALPGGNVAAPYSQTLTASGDTPMTWSVTGGSLPSGLSLSSGGVISGSPDASGTYTFTVTASNAAGTDSAVLSITLTATVPPTIVSGFLSWGVDGVPYSQTLAATGHAVITWALDVGSMPLPAGLGISSDGVISGTPTATGIFEFTVVATNDAGSDTKGLFIVIDSVAGTVSPTITTSSLVREVVGTPYNDVLAATGDPTIVWTVDSGSLPNGLSLSLTGVISGTPTADGIFEFTVRATNGAGFDMKDMFIVIDLVAGVVPPAITTVSVSGGTQGMPYTFTLAATGDPIIAWTLDSGVLPSGVTLSPSGVISGTPVFAGIADFYVKAENWAGSDVSVMLSLIVSPSAAPAVPPVITTPSLPRGIVGTQYTEILTATGDPTIVWSVSAGLPDGLSISPSGKIYGVPTVSGIFEFTVMATNGLPADSKDLYIVIDPSPATVSPSITTSSLPRDVILLPYIQTLSASGDPVLVWTVVSGTLPAGLHLSLSGTISGTPTALGIYEFTVMATNGAGSDTKDLYIVIDNTPSVPPVPPSITTSSLPREIVGTPYSRTLTASGDLTMVWTLASGNLPDGLGLSLTGVISGTPTALGIYEFTVMATNGAGSDTKDLYIVIDSAWSVPPSITTSSLPREFVGTPYSRTLTASGDLTVVWAVVSGSLPGGLDISLTGVISGTPTADGIFEFTVMATNGAGFDTRDLYIVIDDMSVPPELPAITTSTLPWGLISTPYSTALAASGDPTMIWALVSGSLPGGLNISMTGIISGTPTVSGVFEFTVTAANGSGSDTKDMFIVIDTVPASAAPSITTAVLARGSVGVSYGQTLTADGDAIIAWTVVSGVLPGGVTLSLGGQMSGTPNTGGLFIFTVRAQNAAGYDDRELYVAVDTVAGTTAPAITTDLLERGVLGSSYIGSLAATGDPIIVWTHVGGSLPNGISVSPAGMIYGTPNASGIFVFTVRAENTAGYDSKELYLVVDTVPGTVPPTITASSLAAGIMGAEYSRTLTADGDQIIVWTIVSGSLPNGMRLSKAGTISGTPTVTGAFMFTVQASNAAGCDVKVFAMSVESIQATVPPTITTNVMDGGIVGTPYSQTLTADGNGVISWMIWEGILPEGVGLAPAGTISGTPTVPGVFMFTVRAMNGAGYDLKELFIVVDSVSATVPPTITTDALQRGTEGVPYNSTLTASGDPTVVWVLASGNLPNGLRLSLSGTVSGTPGENGLFAFTVTAYNGAGSDTKEVFIVIDGVPASAAPRILSSSLSRGIEGTSYDTILAAEGGPIIFWTITSGSLPNGLVLSRDGRIYGTSVLTGIYAFTIEAENAAGTDSKDMFIVIDVVAGTVPPMITSTTLPRGITATPYSCTLTATGDMITVWTIVSGSLPDGLVLSLNGVISGSPTEYGIFEFTVWAENAAGYDTKDLFIAVDDILAPATVPPTIVTDQLPDGIIGRGYSRMLTASGDPTIAWTVVSGSLPNGMSLTPSGNVTGTPTVTGKFTFTVMAENVAGYDIEDIHMTVTKASGNGLTFTGAVVITTLLLFLVISVILLMFAIRSREERE